MTLHIQNNVAYGSLKDPIKDPINLTERKQVILSNQRDLRYVRGRHRNADRGLEGFFVGEALAAGAVGHFAAEGEAEASHQVLDVEVVVVGVYFYAVYVVADGVLLHVVEVARGYALPLGFVGHGESVHHHIV